MIWFLLLVTAGAFAMGCLCCGAQAAVPTKQASHRQLHAARRNCVILRNSSGYSIILSSPIKAVNGSIWQKIEVRNKLGKTTTVTNIAHDEPNCGYEPAQASDLWSPDGKYAIFYHDELGPQGKQDDRLFVSCETGRSVAFTTARGTIATLDNCNSEWVKGKPHSLEVLEDNGKEMEALPDE